VGRPLIPLVGEILDHSINGDDIDGMWIVCGDQSSRYLARNPTEVDGRQIFLFDPATSPEHPIGEFLCLSSSLSHLQYHDIVTFSLGNRRVYVQWKNGSQSNSVLLTERCDNYCVMCSQPPKTQIDDHLLKNAHELVSALKLIHVQYPTIGLTGGEPTLYGTELIGLIERILEELPELDIHLLTNGRRFADIDFCEQFRRVLCERLVLGIPVYGSIADDHDRTVGASGAFFDTIQGVQNLLERHAQIELRVVIQKSTFQILGDLSNFIVRNLPGVAQVSLMGLELMGLARTNFDKVWVDPIDYIDELRNSVRLLDIHGFNPRIFNHQLCVIDPDIRSFAVRSISDWKQDYDEICDECALRPECGGFFSSSELAISRAIKPLKHMQDQPALLHRKSDSNTDVSPASYSRRRLKVSVDPCN
jgi:His-Xaa-Ser system radical SAM maturase HxsC